MLRIAVRNIRRNARRSLLSGLAIALSVLSILVLLSLVDGMQHDMQENLITYYSGEVRLRHSDYSAYERFTPLHFALDEAAIQAALKELPTPVTATARTALPITFGHADQHYSAMAIGTNTLTDHPQIDFSSLLVAGALPLQDAQAIVIAAGLAKRASLEVGDELILFGRGTDQAIRSLSVTVAAIVYLPVSELNASAIYLDLADLQELLQMEHRVQEFLLYGQEGQKPAQLAATVQTHLARQGITVESRSFDQISELYGFFAIVRISYAFIALLFFFLGSTTIINTTMMVIWERMQEIGTMKALGMDDRAVRRLFVIEGAIISLLGAIVGLLFGLGTIAILGRIGLDFTDALSGVQMEVSMLLYPQARISSSILVFLFAIVVATASTYIATRRSERVSVVDALHDK